MTDKEFRRTIKFLNKVLKEETQRRKWYERMYNLAIGEVGRWRTQECVRQQKSD